MLYYPQLISGTAGQFPLTQRMNVRTIANELISGDAVRMSDPNDQLIRWQLQYTGLTDSEWASIEQLFETTEGRLGTFTFLDPSNNLLSWSEDWTKSVWVPDPMLQVVKGMQDALGGTNAMQLTNTSQTTQRIMQTVAGASWFQYCYSVYLRSDTPCMVALVISASGQELKKMVATPQTWERSVYPGRLSVTQDGIAFGIEMPAGVRVQAFGPQVEAQAGASEYKRTDGRCGVYSKSRFDTDALRVKTNAPGQNSGAITLVSSLL